jgi:hypothetical protein
MGTATSAAAGVREQQRRGGGSSSVNGCSGAAAWRQESGLNPDDQP